ncbi:MAG: leucine-rich repeat domain-containing protein [Oscillospiraceae bacterium]|nr:leucine-rich repeat domain-containing protein [Oscillospiraceae bacterium]
MKISRYSVAIILSILCLLLLFGCDSDKTADLGVDQKDAASESSTEESVPEYLSYNVKNGEVEITDCDTKLLGKVEIPAMIEGCPVTSIGSNAFSGCSSISAVIIPESVVNIESLAFSYCDILKTITIPLNVTYIGDGVFLRCDSLTSINVDEENTAYSSVDGVLYDKNKTYMIRYPEGKEGEAFEIPESVIVIERGAFANCDSLVSIVMPDNLLRIEDNAFSSCRLLSSISLPESVNYIGLSAFFYCSSLSEITIPKSVFFIENNVFYGCESLNSICVDDSNDLFCSVDGVLYDKDMTTLIWYPTAKAESSFTIPKGIVTVKGFAFCRALTSVTIPNSVMTISDWAFANCESLTDVYYKGTQEEWNAITVGSDNEYLTEAVIHCGG